MVPCYNQADFLPETLASIAAQSFQAWECHIVNDGSQDNTAEVAKKWIAKDQRFRYLEKSNGGLASARNAGIHEARGKFILPLDSDDLLDESYLEKGLNRMSSERRVVTTHVEFFGTSKGVWIPPGVEITDFVHKNTIVCTSLYPKSLWEELGGYDEMMRHGFEDWDFWLRASAAGVVFEVIPEPLFKYRRRDNSMLDDAYARRLEVFSYVIEKNADTFQKHFFAAILRREREIAGLQSQLKAQLLSRDYRLGHSLLEPLRRLKRLIF